MHNEIAIKSPKKGTVSVALQTMSSCPFNLPAILFKIGTNTDL